MARLFADENFPLDVVRGLRQLGHDVETIQGVGFGDIGLRDPDVLQTATARDRALLTLNRRDFVKLHLTQPNYGGLIVCTFDPNFAQQAARIDAELKRVSLLRGLLIRVNRPA